MLLHKLTSSPLIIVTGYAKVGSTLTYYLLDSHPDTKTLPGEPLQKNHHFDKSTFKDPKHYIDWYASHAPNKHLLFKFMSPAVYRFPTLWQHFAGRSKIIYCYRQNIIDVLISSKMSNKTYSNKDGYGNATIIITKNELLEFSAHYYRTNNAIRMMINEQHLPVLPIIYEELVQNRNEVCNKMLDFLGLKHISLSTTIMKRQRKKQSQVIKNYEQLQKWCVGTALENSLRG